ncbi:transposase domain-containing protein [Streptomyces sp. NPDC056161]|uniref:transposase domain-containing protein n=1 Tax=Streptomyces sp. NPDC056161 TaxID=3345732 RepID=UPI0035D86D91
MLTQSCPPELVDRVVGGAGRSEKRRRLLSARFTVYFVLATCLFPHPCAQVVSDQSVVAAVHLGPGAVFSVRVGTDGAGELCRLGARTGHMAGDVDGPAVYYWEDKTKLLPYVPYAQPARITSVHGNMDLLRRRPARRARHRAAPRPRRHQDHITAVRHIFHRQRGQPRKHNPDKGNHISHTRSGHALTHSYHRLRARSMNS